MKKFEFGILAIVDVGIEGESGTKGASMSQKEILTSMARLSLTGKLHLAISDSICKEYACMIPYYEWRSDIKPEILMRQILVPLSASLHVIHWERVLSILLKNSEEFC